MAEDATEEVLQSSKKKGGFWSRLGQRIKNGFTGHGFKTNEQLLPEGTVTTTETYWLKPNFYSASVNVSVASETVTYVPDSGKLYYAPGLGNPGFGASLTGGKATDPDGYASGLSGSLCGFYGVGGCGGVSLSGDTAVQVGIGLGGGVTGSFGIDPVGAVVQPMLNSIPVDPNLRAPVAFGLTDEDLGMPQ